MKSKTPLFPQKNKGIKTFVFLGFIFLLLSTSFISARSLTSSRDCVDFLISQGIGSEGYTPPLNWDYYGKDRCLISYREYKGGCKIEYETNFCDDDVIVIDEEGNLEDDSSDDTIQDDESVLDYLERTWWERFVYFISNIFNYGTASLTYSDGSTCDDSDGKDKYESGVVTSKAYGYEFKDYDYCVNPNQVGEYYCPSQSDGSSSNLVSVRTYDCDNGCSDGKCKKSGGDGGDGDSVCKDEGQSCFLASDVCCGSLVCEYFQCSPPPEQARTCFQQGVYYNKDTDICRASEVCSSKGYVKASDTDRCCYDGVCILKRKLGESCVRGASQCEEGTYCSLDNICVPDSSGDGSGCGWWLKIPYPTYEGQEAVVMPKFSIDYFPVIPDLWCHTKVISHNIWVTIKNFFLSIWVWLVIVFVIIALVVGAPYIKFIDNLIPNK